MAQLSKSAFLSKWASLFADNSTRNISELDLRDFRQDIADSFLGSLDDVYKSYLVSTLGTNNYTATPNPAISALTNNNRFFINFSNPNTGASTLNLSGLGAVPIVRHNAAPVEAGDLDGVALLVYRQSWNHFEVIGGTNVIDGGTL